MKLTKEEEELILNHRAATVQWEPRRLDEYTVEEKCEVFDKLYNGALKTFNYVKENGYEDDAEHYRFEDVMLESFRDKLELLNRPFPDNKLWELYNSFIG